MFTLKVQKDAKAAKVYFEEHLSSNEKTAGYYVNGRDISLGKWAGEAGKEMGLNPGSAVSKNDFEALISNLSPDGSKKITPRQKDNRRLYFDGTMSAPKSVSIMALVADDERLIKAHQDANDETLAFLQGLAQTRVRASGKNELRKTGNLLAAQFTHTTSRSNDPHLHTHNVILNFTWDEIEKKFKALEASQLYNQATFITEYYRNALAKRVLDLGYEIESDVHGFKIKGVSNELCELYSKRSAVIKNAISKKEKKLGRKLSNNEKSNITHQTRDKKEKNLTFSQVKEGFLNQISRNQLLELTDLVGNSKHKSKQLQERKNKEQILAGDLVEKRKALDEQIAINKGLMHLFERSSVVSIEDVLKASIQTNLGKLEIDKLKKVLLEREDVFIKENLVVSKEELAREWFCVDFVNSKIGGSTPIFEKIDDSFLSSIREKGLREDQQSSLLGLLTCKDGVVSLRGAAGAGKSHTISLLINELKKQKIEVLPLAPTAGAAENLRSDFNLDTMTLQGFLKSRLSGKNPKYLIVDEAGLCSLKQMKDLFTKAEDLGAKILLVGDTRQNLSVEAGDSLRVLERFSQISTFELLKIERQKPIEYRSAIQSLVDLNVDESFSIFEKMGSFIEHEETKDFDNPLHKEVAKEYVKDLLDKKKSLVVSFSWSDINSITEAIREELKTKKLLSESDSLKKEVFEDLALTASERLTPNTFFKNAPELHVVLRKDVKGLKKNVPYKVLSTTENSFLLQKNDSLSACSLSVGFKQDADLSPVEFSVTSKKEISISEGEKLLLQYNYKSDDKSTRGKKKNNFLNGEIVSVESTENGEIKLSDGRTLPKDYNLFTYGYAVTSVASQGKTADKVIVAASNASGRAVSYNSFYVAASRGKNEISIHVNDLDRIKETLKSVATRESAMELIHKTVKDLDPEEQKKWLDVKNESGRVFGQNIHENFLMEQISVQEKIQHEIRKHEVLVKDTRAQVLEQRKKKTKERRMDLYKQNSSFVQKQMPKNKELFLEFED